MKTAMTMGLKRKYTEHCDDANMDIESIIVVETCNIVDHDNHV